jgi:hypothetical protein
MGLGMLYVCMEWCLQAHLSTEDYNDAMRGLKNARRFRRFTFWMRYPGSVAVSLLDLVLRVLRLRKSSQRRTLVWAMESRPKDASKHSLSGQETSCRSGGANDVEKDGAHANELARPYTREHAAANAKIEASMV